MSNDGYLSSTGSFAFVSRFPRSALSLPVFLLNLRLAIQFRTELDTVLDDLKLSQFTPGMLFSRGGIGFPSLACLTSIRGSNRVLIRERYSFNPLSATGPLVYVAAEMNSPGRKLIRACIVNTTYFPLV